jgi:hypothetical protein
MLAGRMSKSFTHENERALRQTPQPERESTTESAQAALEAQAARAAWQAYVGSLTAAESLDDRPRRRKSQAGVAHTDAKAEDKAPEEKA